MKILLIGLGALGQRYLESFNKSPVVSEIEVFDINIDSFHGLSKFSRHPIRVLTSLESRSPVDLTIVATTTIGRETIYEQLAQNLEKSHYYLFEKPLGVSSEILECLDRFPNLYVNTPRRLWTGYQDIKSSDVLFDRVKVTGGGWGLLGNSIHFLDLITFLTDKQFATYELHVGSLTSHKTKRPGYFDCFGSIVCYGKDKMIELELLSSDSDRGITIEFFDGEQRKFLVDESRNVILVVGECERALDTQRLTDYLPRELDQLHTTHQFNLPRFFDTRDNHKLTLDIISQVKHGLNISEYVS